MFGGKPFRNPSRKQVQAVEDAVGTAFQQGFQSFLLGFAPELARRNQQLETGFFRLFQAAVGEQREIRIAQVADHQSDRAAAPQLE